MFPFFFLLALTSSFEASAQDVQAAAAERVQIRRKLQRLSKRNAWSGVDEAYSRMLALGSAGMTYTDHIQGALASRELGDLQSLIQRLELAVQKKPTADEKDWLNAIRSQCGPVKIRNQRRYKYKLIIEEAPFEMEYNKAIRIAEKALQEEGRFNGYLPNGKYAFGSQVFEVQQGVSTNIVISGGGSDGAHPYVPIGLGGIHMTSGNGENPPMAFGAPALSAGIGYQISFGNWAFNEELLFDGAYVSDANRLAGTAASTVGWQLPLFTPYVGAVFSWGHITRVGVVLTDASKICVCEDAEQRALGTEKSGFIRSFGPLMGIRYDLTPNIGIDLRLGMQSDTSRWYYSGQTALYISLGK